MHRSSLDKYFHLYCRKGDVRALGAAFDEAAPELLRVARRLAGGDEALAEDVVQAVFLTALEKADSFDRKRRVMPWFMGLLAVEVQREQARAGRLPNPAWLQEGAEIRGDAGPGAAAENAELRELIEAKVDELPETYRSAVRGHLFSAVEGQKMADQLGITAGALHVRIHRGMKLLRGALPAGAALSAGLAMPLPRGLDGLRTTVSAKAGALLAGAAAGAGGAATTSAAALVAASIGGCLLGGAAVATLAFTGPSAGGATASAKMGANLERVDQGQDAPSKRRAALLDEADGTKGPRTSQKSEVSRAETGSASPTPQPDHKGPEYWLGEFATADGYNEILILGGRLMALPGTQGLDILRKIYPRLTFLQRQQIGKPFAFNETNSSVLHVLDLLARDPNEGVSKRAWSHLKTFAMQDFSRDPDTYFLWRERTQNLPLAEALLLSASEFATRASNANGAELVTILRDADVPSDENLYGIGVDIDGPLRQGGMASALPRWLASEDPALVSEGLRWSIPVKMDDAFCRTFIAPLLWDERKGTAGFAAHALARSGAPFASELLLERYGDIAQPSEEEATSIDYWRRWTASFR